VLAAAGTTFLDGGLTFSREGFVSSLLVIATLASVYFRLWKRPIEAVEREANVFPAPKPTGGPYPDLPYA